jgi:23S rRNA (cytosine1962-C5)-methyltransferase
VLDGFAHSGAFALQAARNGAEHVVAVDTSEACIKSIGATAQKNDCFIETVQADVAAFLAERHLGELDAIILDPPHEERFDAHAVKDLHVLAFNCLPQGGLLATYCRSTQTTAAVFEAAVAEAAAASGREARIFARTAQPFDFPVLLNMPESRHLKGLILQVE